MLEADKYLSIASAAEGLYKDKGSRFIGYAFPVTSETEVKSLIDNIRRDHHGARHHCWAYRIATIEDCAPAAAPAPDATPAGPRLSKEGLWRANDDGEPSGTAGRQILAQIDSAGLKDVLVVVVRYFGGILLGVPGLIAAYRAAAADAIANAPRLEKTASRTWTLQCGYDALPEVENGLKSIGLQPLKRDFAAECIFVLEVPLGKENLFKEKFYNFIK